LADWLGTPAWFWLSFLGIVVALTAFDLGILHKEDREMGVGESLSARGRQVPANCEPGCDVSADCGSILYSLWKTRGAEEPHWPAPG
jgi:hypothetical protein